MYSFPNFNLLKERVNHLERERWEYSNIETETGQENPIAEEYRNFEHRFYMKMRELQCLFEEYDHYLSDRGF